MIDGFAGMNAGELYTAALRLENIARKLRERATEAMNAEDHGEAWKLPPDLRRN